MENPYSSSPLAAATDVRQLRRLGLKGEAQTFPEYETDSDQAYGKPQTERSTTMAPARKLEENDPQTVKTSRTQDILSESKNSKEFALGVGYPNSLTASSLISSNGGVIKLGNTGVKLEIPPKAFQNDDEKHEIQIRILPHHIFDGYAECFEDHSTTMVEILPNNLRLKKFAKLTLPHCLIVKDGKRCKAQVFQSHHTEGEKPRWEDFSESANPIVSGALCKILLNKFCWVKFNIPGEDVIGKMLFVYIAGEKVERDADCITALVGCFPALPGYKRVNATQEDFKKAGEKRVCEDKVKGYLLGPNWEYFIFRKHPQEPLEMRLTDIFPIDQWKTSPNLLEPKTISYQSIELSVERNWKFTLQRVEQEAHYPTCHFEISHLQEKVGININLQKVQDDNGYRTSRMGICNHALEPMEVEEIVS